MGLLQAKILHRIFRNEDAFQSSELKGCTRIDTYFYRGFIVMYYWKVIVVYGELLKAISDLKTPQEYSQQTQPPDFSSSGTR